MAKTKLLYLHDSYQQTVEAKIVEITTVKQLDQLVLNHTIFYPQGGGQPADHGQLTGKKGSFKVTHTKLDNNKIIHLGKLTGQIKVGEPITAAIDWDRRYQNMQAHTAGHILDEAIKQVLPEFKAVDACHGIGNKYFITFQGFIDLLHKDLIQQTIDQIIKNDEPITVQMVTKQEIIDQNIYVPFKLPENKPLRLITINDRPSMADGGTQLKSTGESWPITLSDFTYDDGHTTIHYQITKPPLDPKIAPAKTAAKTSVNLEQFIQQITQLKTGFPSNNQDTNARTDFLGKKGKLNQLAKIIPQLPQKDRKPAGQKLNQLKSWLEQKLSSSTTPTGPNSSWLDVTAPGLMPPQGHLHPITQAIQDIQHIFESIGFTRVRYPEIDWDYYAFESLNMPSEHPARDEWETFFINYPKHPHKGRLVLTPHTSNGQVREMERVKTPPIRMLNIAKCYRRQQDVTHTAMFHQFEGLVIDRGINISHLKGTLDHFAQKYYGSKARSRIRPFMFRFTEPSFEVDFSCTHCSGRGCRYCKSGWHEVGGAGMVHPNVLKAGGIDPKVYTGFAFGWGIERVFTLKPGLKLDDIRPLYSNNLDFLNQF